jgi:phytanoyl-CoA hydroxylase
MWRQSESKEFGLKKHELNQGFDWQDREGPFLRISQEQADAYNRDGFIVMEDVFDDASIDALVAELDPLEEEGATFLREKLDGKAFIARADEITFTVHAVTRSRVANAFTRSPFFVELTHDLLGPDVRLYWDQAVYKKPGNPQEFPWHQDNGYTFIEPQQYLTCWVALSDADEENGCPWVIPGAHRVGTYAHRLTDIGFVCTSEEPARRLAAPVRKGGVLVFSSLTPHMTGPNLTDRLRKTYIVQFAPDGAHAIRVEDGERSAVRCAEPDRQYSILVGGKAVEV